MVKRKLPDVSVDKKTISVRPVLRKWRSSELYVWYSVFNFHLGVGPILNMKRQRRGGGGYLWPPPQIIFSGGACIFIISSPLPKTVIAVCILCENIKQYYIKYKIRKFVKLITKQHQTNFYQASAKGQLSEVSVDTKTSSVRSVLRLERYFKVNTCHP